MWLTLQHRLYTHAYQEGTHATALQTVLAVLEQHKGSYPRLQDLYDAIQEDWWQMFKLDIIQTDNMCFSGTCTVYIETY